MNFTILVSANVDIGKGSNSHGGEESGDDDGGGGGGGDQQENEDEDGDKDEDEDDAWLIYKQCLMVLYVLLCVLDYFEWCWTL